MNNQKISIKAIINPISGVGSKRKIPKMLTDLCRGENLSLGIAFTEYPGHASEITGKAVEEGADCILAVGGDGTVNEIARSMVYSDTILGIIPKGSGDGLARELHIPMDVKKALDLIIKGHVTTIDACKANDRIFSAPVEWALMRRSARSLRRGNAGDLLRILKVLLKNT